RGRHGQVLTAGVGQVTAGQRGGTRGQLNRTASQEPADSGELSRPEMPACGLGRLVDHGRVGFEDLPQGAQRDGGGIPAALGGAGEFGPCEQLLAEARVEFEQVGLDGVTLGHGRLDRGRRLVPGHHRNAHRYSASRPVIRAMPLPVIGTMTFTILPAFRESFGVTYTDEMRFTGRPPPGPVTTISSAGPRWPYRPVRSGGCGPTSAGPAPGNRVPGRSAASARSARSRG